MKYVVKEKQSTADPSEGEAGDFDLCIEERGLDDIRALGCNSLEDEREFAAVARVSEFNNALYQTFLQPWIKMISGPELARAAIELKSTTPQLFFRIRQEPHYANGCAARQLRPGRAHPCLGR